MSAEPAALQFDAATHTYTAAGVVVPSVTGILAPLNDFSHVPPAVLHAAAQFGSHVHLAVHLWNERRLDESSLDAVLGEYLAGWRKFLSDTGAQVTRSEQRVFSDRHQYAGTLDAVVMLGGILTIVDIKTGAVPRSVGPQLSAYQQAHKETTGERAGRRLCVQLVSNGYRLHPCDNPADWSVFLSCLNVWRFRQSA